MIFDMTDRVAELRRFYDEVLEQRIGKIAELSGVERGRMVKINPANFIEKSPFQKIRGYKYINIRGWIQDHKKDGPDQNFLISPLDSITETAAQISYKSRTEIRRTLRASKCQCVPVPVCLAQDFFIRNHRQTAPLVSSKAVCYGLLSKDELVAVMLYDVTNGAVRGGNTDYELLRLAISKGTVVHGGASKLQAACEEALRSLGQEVIYSYSNATINTGAVYEKLGFTRKKLDGGQPFVVLRDNRMVRLVNPTPISTNERIAINGWLKTHVGGNIMWRKSIK